MEILIIDKEKLEERMIQLDEEANTEPYPVYSQARYNELFILKNIATSFSRSSVEAAAKEYAARGGKEIHTPNGISLVVNSEKYSAYLQCFEDLESQLKNK